MGWAEKQAEKLADKEAQQAEARREEYLAKESEVGDPFVSFRGLPGKLHYVNSRPGLAAFKTPIDAYRDLRVQIAERFPGKKFDLIDFQTEFATAGGMIGWYCYALIREVEG